MTTPNDEPRTRPSVLLLSKEYPPGPGGIGTYAYKVSSHLHRLGWRVALVAEQQRASEAEIAAFNAVLPLRVHRLHDRHPASVGPFKGLYRLAVSLRAALAERPDVLIASHAKLTWIAVLLGVLLRRPVVAIGYGSEFLAPGFIRPRVTRWAYGRADAVVNISRFTEGLMDAAGIRARRRTLVLPGVDAEDFADVPAEAVAALRAKLVPAHAKVVLTVALVSSRKGQDIVIRALPEVRARVPDVHYVIVGAAEQAALVEEYRSLAESLGVADAVHFVGRVEQAALPLYYRACDVFAIASRQSARGSVEGFGIVVAEAALCGKPAVVAEGSGLVEAIRPGETGLAVPPEDPAATAAALIRLLGDEGLRARMGEAARRFAGSEQCWHVRVAEFDRLLRELVRGDA